MERRECVERAFDSLRYRSVASHFAALARWGSYPQALRQDIESHASTAPSSPHRASGVFIRSSISVRPGSVLFYGRKGYLFIDSALQPLVENYSTFVLSCI